MMTVSNNQEAIDKFNSRKGKLQIIDEITKLLETHDFDDLEYNMLRDSEELPDSVGWRKNKPNPWFSINLEAVMMERISKGKRSLKLRGK